MLSMRTNPTVRLKRPHKYQQRFIGSSAKRKVIRAGRRGGKTTGSAILALQAFLAGKRVLYATPTQEQVDAFWNEVKAALEEPLDAGLFYKNETRHIIEETGTNRRIRAKTAWNADTLRGDFADLLILDEYQLMDPDAWELVGAPMLLDNDGDAVFIYTTRRGEKGSHARRMFERASHDDSKRWEAFRFSSFENPHLSTDALDDITGDMTELAFRAEIMAEEIGDDPRALWNRDLLEQNRVIGYPDLTRIVVGVDPPGVETGAECGIVVAGIARDGKKIHGYVLDDRSLRGSPGAWANAVITAYNRNNADRVIGEVNNGGDMVEHTIRSADGGKRVAYKAVRASRGKAIRAEPIAAFYEKGLVHHVGTFGELEDQMCGWVPGDNSPDRIDALVWALTELMLKGGGVTVAGGKDIYQ